MTAAVCTLVQRFDVGPCTNAPVATRPGNPPAVARCFLLKAHLLSLWSLLAPSDNRTHQGMGAVGRTRCRTRAPSDQSSAHETAFLRVACWSPRQRMMATPRAVAIATRVRTEGLVRPASMRDTADWATLSLLASCVWVRPACSRASRTAMPRLLEPQSEGEPSQRDFPNAPHQIGAPDHLRAALGRWACSPEYAHAGHQPHHHPARPEPLTGQRVRRCPPGQTAVRGLLLGRSSAAVPSGHSGPNSRSANVVAASACMPGRTCW
jgi:hypothetical protein